MCPSRYDVFTAVQLRFDFLQESSIGSYAASGISGLIPVTMARTYFSFFDLDTGEPQFDGSQTQVPEPSTI